MTKLVPWAVLKIFGSRSYASLGPYVMAGNNFLFGLPTQSASTVISRTLTAPHASFVRRKQSARVAHQYVITSTKNFPVKPTHSDNNIKVHYQKYIQINLC